MLKIYLSIGKMSGMQWYSFSNVSYLSASNAFTANHGQLKFSQDLPEYFPRNSQLVSTLLSVVS